MEELTLNQETKDELKAHYLKREQLQYYDIDKIPLYSKYGENRYILNNDIESVKQDNKQNNLFLKYKISFMRRTVVALGLFITIFCYRYFPENIKNNKIVQMVKNEYNKSYGRVETIEKIEEISKKLYSKIGQVVPEGMYSSFVNKYVNEIKPKIVDAKFGDFLKKEEVTVAVFNEEDFKINDEDYTPIEEAIAVNSEVSLMAMDVDEILSKNINIIQPVYGTITSEYGTREEILAVVGYHTGVDIANSYNTEIKSATDGKVVKAEKDNFYYGNNIEIENSGVIFKYAHLNKILVNEGDNISQNQIIGLMGATGQATGSHLHFEIKINDRTVDPKMVLEIK